MSQLNSTHQLQRTDPAPPHHRYKEVFFLVASCAFKTSVRVRPNVSLQIIWSEMFLLMEPSQQTSDELESLRLNPQPRVLEKAPQLLRQAPMS